MHLGNARTALLAWLHSRAGSGRHLLRFEDLDRGRVRDFAVDLTRRDLDWLGLDWDDEVRQSERLDLYASALARLEPYPCFCTRREIAEAASAPHGAEPVYAGTCRGRPTVPGRTPALRWRVPDAEVCASDVRLGALCQHLPSEVGDVVLRRADGAYAYHLAVVVDDAAQGVTTVVRGEDLWPSTPRQVALQRALGLPTPEYLHVPLLLDFRGERLAKRGGAPGVSALREAGVPAGRVLADLARSLGWSVPGEVTASELLPLWRAWAAALSSPADPTGRR
jgi:glutamyl-tRNA synthetase